MAKISFRSLNGVLLLDKSINISSNKELQAVRHIYQAKKAGHTGTLDPFATGLLPICFGEANKYSRWLLDADKSYSFTAVLGQQSNTGDRQGNIIIVDKNISIKDSQLRLAEQEFLGEINQIPPKYSAIKINGRRAYNLARMGKEFSITSRRVQIYSLSLSIKDNILEGLVKVSKGTYIRTLVEDIANYLGTVAYCQSLRRLQVGNLLCDDKNNPRPMYKMSSIKKITNNADLDKLLLPIDILCQQFPKQVISTNNWQMLIRGQQTVINNKQNGIVRMYLDDKFHGLGEIQQDCLKAFRLLNTRF